MTRELRNDSAPAPLVARRSKNHPPSPRHSADLYPLSTATRRFLAVAGDVLKSTPPGKAVAQFLLVIDGARENLLAGAAARMASIICIQPLDTIKTKIQMGSPSRVSSAASRAVTRTGAPPFAGVLAAILGQVPYGAFTFAAYELYKQKLADACPRWHQRARVLLAACLGDLTGSLWLAPWEGVKLRVQSGVASSSLQSFTQTARSGDLLTGVVSHVMRDLPFRVLQLTLFEEMRAVYNRKYAKNRELDTVESFAVGAAAGSVTALITTPLDVVRTRVMAQRLGHGASYHGIMDVAQKLLEQEGAKGFLKGALPRVVAVAPSTAIFYLVYEYTLKTIRNNEYARARAAAVSPGYHSKRIPRISTPLVATH